LGPKDPFPGPFRTELEDEKYVTRLGVSGLYHENSLFLFRAARLRKPTEESSRRENRPDRINGRMAGLLDRKKVQCYGVTMARRILHSLPIRFLLTGLTLIGLNGCATTWTQADGPPVLVVDVPRVDLGDVFSGDIIEAVVYLWNTGGDTLWIKKIDTSCGCTVPSWNTDRIEPGNRADLLVRIDTRGKAGPARKTLTLTSNDPVSPQRELTFFFRVNPPEHGVGAIETRSLFSSGCRNCHAERGEGQTGESLFDADCAMCHKGKGAAYSPGAPREVLETLGEPELLSAIRNGVEGSSMPAFSLEHGGPLDEQQIQSLVRYLRNTP